MALPRDSLTNMGHEIHDWIWRAQNTTKNFRYKLLKSSEESRVHMKNVGKAKSLSTVNRNFRYKLKKILKKAVFAWKM